MTVTTATPSFARPRLDIGLAFKNGWNAFTADIVPFLVGALIAGLLSIITLGILAGPLTAGLYNMAIRRMRDGRRAEIGDVFSCFDRFWSYLWAAIVLVVLIGLASLTIVGGVLLATIWIYVFPFMVDRRMGLTDAMAASYRRVVDNGFWEHLALLVIFFAISAVANGWVGIITTPFTIAVIAGAYFASRDYDRQFVQVAAPDGPLAPPAPLAQTAAPTAPVTSQAPVAPATQTAPAAPATQAAPDAETVMTQATAVEPTTTPATVAEAPTAPVAEAAPAVAADATVAETVETTPAETAATAATETAEATEDTEVAPAETAEAGDDAGAEAKNDEAKPEA